MNQAVVGAAYAVRGELVMKADQYQRILADPAQRDTLPFKEIIYCNIGNPQQLHQKPITFFRQVLSCMEYPALIDHPAASQIYPQDVLQRAKHLLANFSGGTGAYSHSKGERIVREHVAAFLHKRDGYAADPEDIYLSDGASGSVSKALNILIHSKKDGVMIPIPQYPLYSATIPLLGGTQLNYYLDEENSWGLKVSELDSLVEDAHEKHVNPRALVIINPGNPTGQCLAESNMQEVIDFCRRRGIVLLADEVYQTNAYTKPWMSFKKVLRDMGPKYKDVELISFHSVSKGVIGECGHRGGFMELVGIDEEVKQQFYKLASISLCPNLPGQVVVDLMVRPPVAGEPSYDLYHKETTDIFESLKRRALRLTEAFNQLEGVTCNEAEGAMYLFPQVRLPAKAVQEALKHKKTPDSFYCLALLDQTGICVVPGSGFGQKDGTYHFRTTFLPPEDKIDAVAKSIGKFHHEFMQKYRG